MIFVHVRAAFDAPASADRSFERKSELAVETENILAVNFPNTVSIVVMAAVGFFLIAMVKKLWGQARGNG